MQTLTVFDSRFSAIIFIFGKFLRFFFFLFFLMLLSSKTRLIAGYSLWQMIFFFLTFNLIDSLVQTLMREVYRFSWQVSSGQLDYILTKPFSPLFRNLFGGPDILDVPTLIMLFIFIFYSLGKINVASVGIFLYFLLILNALIIAVSFHIVVLALGVLTTQIDNAIMFYRDLTQMARVPIDIYREPLKSIITFVIPVGVMITFPAKALMGLLSIEMIFVSFFIGLGLFFLSKKFWDFSLKYYSSASS